SARWRGACTPSTTGGSGSWAAAAGIASAGTAGPGRARPRSRSVAAGRRRGRGAVDPGPADQLIDRVAQLGEARAVGWRSWRDDDVPTWAQLPQTGAQQLAHAPPEQVPSHRAADALPDRDAGPEAVAVRATGAHDQERMRPRAALVTHPTEVGFADKSVLFSQSAASEPTSTAVPRPRPRRR